jgi:ABC-type transport system substrate-binding protein
VTDNSHDQDRRSAAIASLMQSPMLGRLTRRELARRAAALGLAAPAVSAIAGASGVAATTAGRRLARSVRAQEDDATLTLALDSSPADLDPHSANDYRSAIANRGPCENLIALKNDQVDQVEPVLAESWVANDDKSVFTFTLRRASRFRTGHRSTPKPSAPISSG